MSLEPNGRKHDQAAIYVESRQLEPEHIGVTGCDGRGNPVMPNGQSRARSGRQRRQLRVVHQDARGPKAGAPGRILLPSVGIGAIEQINRLDHACSGDAAVARVGCYLATREAHLMTMPDVEAKLNHFVVASRANVGENLDAASFNDATFLAR